MPALLPYQINIDTPMQDFPEGDRLYRGDGFLLWYAGQLWKPPFSDKFLYKDKNTAFYFYAARDTLVSEYPLVTKSLDKFVVHKLWMSVSSGVGTIAIDNKFKKIALANIEAGLPQVKLPFGLITPSRVEFLINEYGSPGSKIVNFFKHFKLYLL